VVLPVFAKERDHGSLGRLMWFMIGCVDRVSQGRMIDKFQASVVQKEMHEV
jgi:hypothetical protein